MTPDLGKMPFVPGLWAASLAPRSHVGASPAPTSPDSPAPLTREATPTAALRHTGSRLSAGQPGAGGPAFHSHSWGLEGGVKGH